MQAISVIIFAITAFVALILTIRAIALSRKISDLARVVRDEPISPQDIYTTLSGPTSASNSKHNRK